ncbi:hypothetical protein SRHO_G00198220 [Serrasalmus rhombeus]
MKGPNVSALHVEKLLACLGSSRRFARLASLRWVVWGAQAATKQQLWNPFTDGKGDVPSVWVKVHAPLHPPVAGVSRRPAFIHKVAALLASTTAA